MTKYQLTVDPDQAKIIINALDLYSRIFCGHLEEIPHVLRLAFKADPDVYGELENSLKLAKIAIFKVDHNGHLPIAGQKTNHNAQIAYDIQQVLRHAVATEEKHSSFSVWHGPPRQISKLPLPEAQVLVRVANLSEGMKKGGQNEPPKTKRPTGAPKGQGKKNDA